ncbi:hypothetical protein P175DRAFT_0371068 [Aspergillus ochraceoroseus IBT 24754]|uniref:Uncharacterized protein n=1 Tax=Aspergillus ochraceoroseus IBT 24754 TaxID=1392256 RepID=A0A2T5LMY1_9EURO|nr:uncharacterized protein P175DRAFT_0371068 [Aspergillus ochraceoroseus IBT 24754]PTU17640.1 hypothetical protein P175DRAFT_0371068 [Aspergillus ochraceoroseus IBT 24754]
MLSSSSAGFRFFSSFFFFFFFFFFCMLYLYLLTHACYVDILLCWFCFDLIQLMPLLHCTAATFTAAAFICFREIIQYPLRCVNVNVNVNVNACPSRVYSR